MPDIVHGGQSSAYILLVVKTCMSLRATHLYSKVSHGAQTPRVVVSVRVVDHRLEAHGTARHGTVAMAFLPKASLCLAGIDPLGAALCEAATALLWGSTIRSAGAMNEWYWFVTEDGFALTRRHALRTPVYPHTCQLGIQTTASRPPQTSPDRNSHVHAVC
jgi:hypothetical protein